MSKSQYINLCFSNKDRELIAWANMIRDDGQSINTWIQALLLAETVGENLDAGAVYVPRVKSKTAAAPAIAAMFGDDTRTVQTKKENPCGWQIRGENGEIVVGSIISVRVTRPVMVALIDKLHHSHKRLGPYAKAVLRRKIRKLDSGPNIPPDETQILDIFALYEDRYVVDSSRQNNVSSSTQGPQTPSRHEEPPQEKVQDEFAVLAETNRQYKNNRTLQHNRNNRTPRSQQTQQQLQAQSPKPQPKPREQEYRETVPKVKNPLLEYIN